MIEIFLLMFHAIIAKLIKLSMIIGSPFLFFSTANCILPLSALLNGYLGLFVMTIFTVIHTIIFAKKSFALTLFSIAALLRIPTIVASLYLKNKSFLFASVISIFCMILFLLHPQGYLAAPYALYWLIPPLLSTMFKEQFFAQCLSATFLQHAVGSVIFLYKTNMVAARWYSIMPLVIVERLILASGMVIAYHLLVYTRSLVEQRYKKRRLSDIILLDSKAL